MQRRCLLRTAPVLAMAGAFGLSGCTRPVYNVESRSFVDSGTPEARRNQILRAGAGLGWEMEPVRPGLVRATLRLRGHVAVTEVFYTADSFSIRHADSTNLQYDGTSIHKNYNGWIENLERAIIRQPPV
ncbi:hypothetical protein GXW74_19740 [Roseomonas eburnea]|uniref:Lipoprotein n=1 Tax=Neoroseomonas eburnea TaxID=1346889 RepID=A0A9X9XG98_9PROT|nr:hypothetical protein [Neoroseomonas eburnea]MBR0682734.1 hypothetical protein [Neoroseomonas eburnea]